MANKTETKSKNEKFSQFFQRLVNYGGISTEPGVVYIWGDPNLLIPIKAFSIFQEKVIEQLGDNGKDIILWAGKISGYQASKFLEERFGIPFTKVFEENHEDIDNLLNGATQDGFGFFKAKNYPKSSDKLIEFSLIATGSNVGEKAASVFGKRGEPRDYFSAGVVEGGSEFLYKKPMIVSEDKCVAIGDSECLYNVKQTSNPREFKLFSKVKVDLAKLEKSMYSVYMRRPPKGKFLDAKNIKFGDGNFILYDLKGVIVATRAFAPLIYILKKAMSDKDYEEVISSFTKGYVEDLKKIISARGFSKLFSTKDLKNLIYGLNLIGFGEFNVINRVGTYLMIENKTNPYAKDYLSLFGVQKSGVDDIICAIMGELFSDLTGKKVNVSELECITSGKKRCLFKISFS